MPEIDVSFFTIGNYEFFIGLVALLNSLSLTGHHFPHFLLDLGFTAEQGARLEQVATLVPKPTWLQDHPTVFKAFPKFVDPKGVVVLIDADMIVTRSLENFIAKAALGKICVFVDPADRRSRWFAEWSNLLGLRAPLRRQPYVNAGFVAFSTLEWPGLLERFWELCRKIPPGSAFTGAPDKAPFWAGDQDILNALIMSEIPEGAVELLPATGQAYPEELRHTKIVDQATLACDLDGDPTYILHYSLTPKPWGRDGWTRVRSDDAYVRLLPRVVCGSDVRMRLESRELPLWLRPGRVGRATLMALDRLHGGIDTLTGKLPRSAPAIGRLRDRIRGIR